MIYCFKGDSIGKSSRLACVGSFCEIITLQCVLPLCVVSFDYGEFLKNRQTLELKSKSQEHVFQECLYL